MSRHMARRAAATTAPATTTAAAEAVAAAITVATGETNSLNATMPLTDGADGAQIEM